LVVVLLFLHIVFGKEFACLWGNPHAQLRCRHRFQQLDSALVIAKAALVVGGAQGTPSTQETVGMREYIPHLLFDLVIIDLAPVRWVD